MVVTCSKCQTQLRLEQEISPGMAVQCPQCQMILRVSPQPKAKKETKPGKKRKQKKRPGISISTWIVAGFGIIAMAVIGLFGLGLMGYGPFDFNRKERVRDYCQEINAKLNFLSVLMKENSPGVITQLFDSDKSLEHFQKSQSKIQQTRIEVEKKNAPGDCHQVKQATITLLQRLEKWAGEDIPRARELLKKDRAGAEALLQAAHKELRAATERIQAELETLQKKYYKADG